jgi:Lrp/AsnC family leucine-responsive transcriptional regulator
MSRARNFNDTDAKILTILQENARTSHAEIARTVGLAPSAVLERVRKLEARGIIRGYVAELDPEALDLRMLAFVAVRTTDRPGDLRVAHAVATVPEVLEVHDVAGDDCLFLKIRARDAAHLSQILRDRLGVIDGISSTKTTIVLETVKEGCRLAIDQPAARKELAS